jgi:D-tyrosyl-tRNA(Tyr) deacylase
VIGLIQRVCEAHVDIGGRTVGAIDQGLLVLACAEPSDGEEQVERFLAKLLKLRIFSDDAGKMNRSIQDLDGAGRAGGLLIVSQFTLAADTSGGNRPSFTGAAPAAQGRALYERLLERARALHPVVASGEFGAEMQVHLVNDGPVTIPLRIT